MSDSNEQEYMESGLEALQMGDYNAAQVFFKQAIRVNNANEEAWLSLAKTYPTEPEKARKCYENALKINPLNAEAARMIERLDATAPAVSAAPEVEAAYGGGAAVYSTASESADDLRAATGAAPAGRKPIGGPSVTAPKGIPGAPDTVNLDYFVDFFQRAAKGSMALLTGQGDGSAEVPTSWWNATVLTVAAGLITGLVVFIVTVRFASFLTILTVPLLATIMTVVGVGAGAFLSHWYLRTYRDGTASLLDHTMTYVRVWFPATIIFAVVLLIAGLTSNTVPSLGDFLRTFWFTIRDLGIVFLIINAAVAVYSALLLHRHWGRLYPNVGSAHLWIAVVIALAVTSFAF